MKLHPLPKKLTYEESSFGGEQYLIELQRDSSLGLMKAYGCLPVGIRYLDYSRPSAETWSNFKKNINAFDSSGLNEELVCDGVCLELWVTYRRRIRFSAITGGSEKLDELREILNPITICEGFPEGIFFEEFKTCD